MGNRNRSAKARRESKKQHQHVSLIVDWFNQQENERLYQASHASAAMPHPLYAQPEKRKFYATLPIAGYLNWFMISAIPVQMSQYTEMGMSQTGRIMSRM
jgi:hypothetical protein